MRLNPMLLSLALFISGCATVPPTYPKFPDHPEAIGSPCPDLNLVKDGEDKLSEILNVVVINYGKYHECRAKVQAWIDWHSEQKRVNGELK